MVLMEQQHSLRPVRGEIRGVESSGNRLSRQVGVEWRASNAMREIHAGLARVVDQAFN